MQYILRGIEEFYLSHTAELSIRDFTIEHIANDDGTESHCTIGNLLMLADPINGNASNKIFKEKIPHYVQSQFVSTKKYVERERKFLEQGLKQRGFFVFPSSTNFILIYSNKPLYEQLLKKGILIRDCKNFRGLSQGFYRIAVKSRKENEILLETL